MISIKEDVPPHEAARISKAFWKKQMGEHLYPLQTKKQTNRNSYYFRFKHRVLLLLKSFFKDR